MRIIDMKQVLVQISNIIATDHELDGLEVEIVTEGPVTFDGDATSLWIPAKTSLLHLTGPGYPKGVVIDIQKIITVQIIKHYT